MFTEAYLEPSRTSTMMFFSLPLSHILKTYLIRSNRLEVPFFTQLTFCEKTYNSKNFGRKSVLLSMEHFFFRNPELHNGMVPSVNKSSHRRCSIRKGVLRNFAKFTGKHPHQSLSFNKVVGLRHATLLKKRLQHRYFPVNFAKFLRTPFLQNTSRRLFLNKKGFLESNKSFKTACDCTVFFFHYFKYGQNIFQE